MDSVEEINCECEENYSGRFCDYCANRALLYPDCDPARADSANIYDPKQIHEFLNRAHYSLNGYSTKAERYFPDGQLHPNIFNEECGWVDYPDDLDRIEYMREFRSGEFHVADVYTVNHKQDNVMKFVPKQPGVIKVLVQQPEETTYDEPSYDIEIGIYDAQSRKFVAQGMNAHYRLPNKKTLKLEQASVSYEITQQHIDEPMYIFVRALNFTDEDGSGHRSSDGCLALYFEIEYRAASHECFNDPILATSTEITQLSTSGGSDSYDLGNDGVWHSPDLKHSIHDPHDIFFTYRDFYIKDGQSNPDADVEVTVSVQQNFHERNTVDLLVEVLDRDKDISQIRSADYPSQLMNFGYGYNQGGRMSEDEAEGRALDATGIYGPSCKHMCVIGGEKSFNEMRKEIVLSPRTYFRVWLMQTVVPSADLQSQWCANYQFFVTAKETLTSTSIRFAAQEEHCLVEELPASLNTPRYLQGPKGEQKDFNYKQAFRVDHLWHNRAHRMDFKLQEPTVVRVLAPQHKHLEYEVILMENHGPYSRQVIQEGVLEDHHSGVFAQLAPGDYSIKLAFASDAELLQAPC